MLCANVGYETWKEDFEALLGQDMLDRYCSPERWIMIPHNPLHVFPARHFMRERWADCELLIKVARIMLGDEQTLSVWHSLGNDMYDLRELLDCCLMITLTVPNSGAKIDEIHTLSNNGIPYLLHFGGATLEAVWRRGIGAI